VRDAVGFGSTERGMKLLQSHVPNVSHHTGIENPQIDEIKL
jgi:hypothetical protein